MPIATSATLRAVVPGPIGGHGPLAGQPLCGDGREAGVAQAALGGDGFVGFFTNFGRYMPRTHCMLDQAGNPDWPWIILLIGLTAGIIVAYLRIYWFWMRTHRAQDAQDRNHKMFELAKIFFWCTVCGYVFSILAFAWPAYRLLVGALLLLNIWSWKFVLTDLGDFKSSLMAKQTERKLSEALRDRNARLEREVEERTAALEAVTQRAIDANLAKSRFLASMSHEIRTPLAAIMGYAQLMQDARAEGHAIDVDASLKTITQNAMHLLTLIDDILDVSKVEAGRMKVEMLSFNPLRLVADVVELLKDKAQSKGLSLSMVVDAPVPAAIRSDPTRLRQILLNLTGNAIKFTNEGYVSIRVMYQPDSNTLAFAVHDSGIGMTEGQVRTIRAFRAFTQADTSTTREYGGTGLGLRISAALASLLGGTLSVESDAGIGSTFTASIACGDVTSTTLIHPLSAQEHATKPLLLGAHARPAARNPKDDAALQGRRVLVVDDGKDNRRLFEFHMSRAGADTVTATDGQQAVDTFEEALAAGSPFDLVLMDMQMPRMDGYTATRLLRSRGHKTPIIAVTANAMDEDCARCLSAGCDAYLSKPVDRKTLLATCARQIGAHSGAARA